MRKVIPSNHSLWNFVTLTLMWIAFSDSSFSQIPEIDKKENKQKGSFFLYWGWNRAFYTKSDIHFTGKDYDFTLYDVIANDRPTEAEPTIYLNPSKMTIPQNNIRLGYFFNSHYNISLGIDHMKYVVKQFQEVKISGSISGTETAYDDTYSNEDITLSPLFLKYEHTDGLNYYNVEIRRADEIGGRNKITFNLIEGFGLGALYPRSDVKLLNNKRNDEFHWAGYGVSAMVAVNVQFYKKFFIQTEFKGGFINLPDVRTTNSKADKASQHFYFTQFNLVLGSYFSFRGKQKVSVAN